jgi:hypothetical protein
MAATIPSPPLLKSATNATAPLSAMDGGDKYVNGEFALMGVWPVIDKIRH